MNSNAEFCAKYAQLLVNNNKMYQYLNILENKDKYSNNYLYHTYNMLLELYNNSQAIFITEPNNSNLVFIIKIANFIKDRCHRLLSSPIKCKAINCFDCDEKLKNAVNILLNISKMKEITL